MPHQKTKKKEIQMRVVLMGRKPGSCKALKYLIEKGIEIAVVVTHPRNHESFYKERLADTAYEYGIPVASDVDLYNYLKEEKKEYKQKYEFSLENIDLVISYLFWKRIQEPLRKLPKLGCINFHPAPLPDFKGVFGYNFAIYEELNFWGVSAHHVVHKFDSGDIIKVLKFDIDPKKETAYSLEQKTQTFLYDLFKDVIDEIIKKNKLPRYPNEGGRYICKEDFIKLREIKMTDNHDEIDRKIRSSWFPPHDGAFITINGKRYTVINEEILKRIGKKYHS